MKKADNFDAKKWLVENKITFQSRLNENINNNDLKLYYDILMDVGGEDLAGEYEDIQAKASKFNSTSDFIKNDLEILSQDDEDQVNDIKTDFVAAKLRKMSPQEFTDFVKEVGDYDFWSDAPNGIDPFNNVGDRMDVLSTNEVEDTNRYFNALFKSSNMNESRLNEEEDEDNDYDLNDAFKAAPSVAPYEKVLDIIKSYEDESILRDFKSKKSKFPEGKPVNKKDYSDFAITLIDDMSEVDFVQANWISIFDKDVYEKAGLI